MKIPKLGYTIGSGLAQASLSYALLYAAQRVNAIAFTKDLVLAFTVSTISWSSVVYSFQRGKIDFLIRDTCLHVFLNFLPFLSSMPYNYALKASAITNVSSFISGSLFLGAYYMYQKEKEPMYTPERIPPSYSTLNLPRSSVPQEEIAHHRSLSDDDLDGGRPLAREPQRPSFFRSEHTHPTPED